MAKDDDGLYELMKEMEKRQKQMKADDPKKTLAEINKAIAEVKSMKKDTTGVEDA